ncbi:MAG: hypothetical protein WD184_03795 [Acidimicrobiia bacterium]
MIEEAFCALIRNRSIENQTAMGRVGHAPVALSPTFSIIRQELDSMIRVIYLLNVEDLEVRRDLMRMTVEGETWSVRTTRGRARRVTDRDMVALADRLQGWSEIVYRFGCAFVHLSNLHGLDPDDPLDQLPPTERGDVLRYLRNYHGGPQRDTPDLEELGRYLPLVLSKISSNLMHYVRDLEASSVWIDE